VAAADLAIDGDGPTMLRLIAEPVSQPAWFDWESVSSRRSAPGQESLRRAMAENGIPVLDPLRRHQVLAPVFMREDRGALVVWPFVAVGK